MFKNFSFQHHEHIFVSNVESRWAWGNTKWHREFLKNCPFSSHFISWIIANKMDNLIYSYLFFLLLTFIILLHMYVTGSHIHKWNVYSRYFSRSIIYRFFNKTKSNSVVKANLAASQCGNLGIFLLKVSSWSF